MVSNYKWGKLLEFIIEKKKKKNDMLILKSFKRGYTFLITSKQKALFANKRCIHLTFLVMPTNRYNLFKLVDYFHSRGLYRSIFLRYLLSSLNWSLEFFFPFFHLLSYCWRWNIYLVNTLIFTSLFFDLIAWKCHTA